MPWLTADAEYERLEITDNAGGRLVPSEATMVTFAISYPVS